MSKLHTYHFPFLSSEIKFEFVDNIAPEIAEGVSNLIHVLKNDLSTKQINSSAHKLSNATTKLPVIVSPEFIEYFELNLKYYSATQSSFSPFSEKIDKYKINEYIEINKEEDAIIKLKNFRFDSTLLKFYILKKINAFLDFNGVRNYYFSYVDVAGSFGNVRWNAKFNASDFNKEIEFKLYNSYAYMFIPDSTKEEKFYSKFANVDKEVKANYIVVKGANLIDLKILSLEIENLNWLHQYKLFAQENNVSMTIFTQEQEIIEI